MAGCGSVSNSGQKALPGNAAYRRHDKCPGRKRVGLGKQAFYGTSDMKFGKAVEYSNEMFAALCLHLKIEKMGGFGASRLKMAQKTEFDY